MTDEKSGGEKAAPSKMVVGTVVTLMLALVGTTARATWVVGDMNTATQTGMTEVRVELKGLGSTVVRMENKLEKLGDEFHGQHNGFADLRARMTAVEALQQRSQARIDGVESRLREIEKK